MGSKNNKKRIYLDYASSTPVDSRVVKAMEPYWSDSFGNAGSVHKEGQEAKDALNEARKKIARDISAHSNEIIFTSGGTESNNIAIFGVIAALERSGTTKKDMHIITSVIEHPSVLDCFSFLKEQGVEVSFIGVNENGIFNLKEFEEALRPNTVLVSLMYVNNEIGTVQPISTVSKIIKNLNEENNNKNQKIYFHTDACQAPLYFNCDVNRLGVDLMTIDAQKIYGPKGVGFLYKRRGVLIESIFKGGNQESGLRPGTENTPLAVGISEAFSLAVMERDKESERLIKLRDYFIKEILQKVKGAELNGDAKERSPNNINISIPGIDAEFFVLKLDANGIAIGSRSACIAQEGGKSYVITSLGRGDIYADSSLRFTLGKGTTKKSIDYVVEVMVKA